MPASKKKFENKGSGGKPNGKLKRGILRDNNRAWMNRYRSKTRQFKRERTAEPPGKPRGLHLKVGECHCGSCSQGIVAA